ncbi:hypothetical protein D1007_02852 [Hordeum vulgare]|nr:hypothetical protein D1007_02852 [Hordeum vulgare]
MHEPGSSSRNQVDVDPIIKEEQPDDVPTDDEDELMHPEFIIGKKPKGKEATQHDDYVAPPEFDQTGSHEREEENDMGYCESSDEARTDVHFDRDDPSLAEGTIFSHVVECRNALATYAIKTQSEFKIDKSEPGRLRVHCAYRSPKKNTKRVAERGTRWGSPQKKAKGSKSDVSKRSKATNPAANTRSKRAKLV